MTLEQALVKLEELKKENIKLKNRVKFLEKMMYDESILDDYNDYYGDDYDPRFD